MPIEVVYSVLGAILMIMLNDMRESIKEASKSVEKLNTNVAIILERVEKHDEEIAEHKTQLQELNIHVQEIKQKNLKEIL